MSNGARGRSRFHRFFAAAAGLLIALPSLLALGAEPVSDQTVVHLLNRLAFGPTLEEVRHVKTIGVERYIAEQLDPNSIPEPIELRWRLAQLDTLKLNPVQLRQLYGPLRSLRGFKPNPELEKAQRERVQIILRDASEARILRALLSPRQLHEVMVDFWFNHFNVFSGKGLDDVWIGNYEQQAIRPFVLGRFRDLLFATTKHPAMLVYLDNALSTAPGSPGARGRQKGLNENFAREVMELHTLGANGGYTQEDVVTLARVLTGWGVNPPNARLFPEYAAVFEGARHDYSPKVFLGHPLQSRGKAEGEEALDILAHSPATAHHIAFELAQYFVADEPPPELGRAARGTVSRDRRQYTGDAEDAFRQQRILGQQGRQVQDALPIRDLGSARRGSVTRQCPAAARRHGPARDAPLRLPDAGWVQEHRRRLAQPRRNDPPHQLCDRIGPKQPRRGR